MKQEVKEIMFELFNTFLAVQFERENEQCWFFTGTKPVYENIPEAIQIRVDKSNYQVWIRCVEQGWDGF